MSLSDNVLIVGGAGYIGSHTNLLFGDNGLSTIVLDNLVYGHRSAVLAGEFVRADLSDLQSLRNAFLKYRINAVVHFAAFAYVGESVLDPAKYYDNNVTGTLNLLAIMREFDVKQIVFSSSCAVYGIPQYLPLDEAHPTRPVNPYGRSKLMIEQILADYGEAYDLEYVILRYFNAAGADLDGRIGESHSPETHLIPLVLKSVLDPQVQLQIYGDDYDTPDGTCIRDYVHVQDLAAAHFAALEYLRAGGRNDIFNLGNENGYSVTDVIRAAEEVTGSSIGFKVDVRRPGDPPILISNTDKARKNLAWQPEIPDLTQIIKSAWQWEINSTRLNNAL